VTKNLVISVDCSTSASKAIVWDKTGRPLAEGRASFSLLNPHPAWWEQRAEDWWEATSSALRTATSAVDVSRLAAIGLTHQRETFVPVDSAGVPLRDGILWLDERAWAELDDIDRAFGADKFHQVSGKPLCMTPSIPKIVWLRKHEPAVFERTDKYLDVHAYLVHKLTGQYKTSWASADPMGAFDMVNHCWAEELLTALDLRVDQFVEVVPPGTVMSTVSREAAERCGLPVGLPVVAGLGDGQSAGLGANITTPGQAYLNLGTAVVCGAFSENYAADPAFRTLNGGVPNTYLLETVIRGGTFTISWFLEKFGGIDPAELKLDVSAEEIFEAAARRVPPGSRGLMLVPYWSSVTNPYWDAMASGIMVGWRGAHDRAHMYRAILEGIAFEQRLATSGVEQPLGYPLERLVAVGGGSKSPLWCQIIADICGKPVIRSASPEATCLGAAILAAVSAGFYGSAREAAAGMVRLGEIHRPDPERQEFYDRLYGEVYRHLFPALRPFIDRLAELTHGDSD
jgi:xylulokinase